MPDLVQIIHDYTNALSTMTNSTNISTTAPITSGVRTNPFIDRTNSCKCENNGTCYVYPRNLFSCECESGFQGVTCRDLIFNFNAGPEGSYGKNPNTEMNGTIPSIIAVASIAILITLVSVFVMWRKWKSAQQKNNWVRWQESRRQSKATIEGPTIVDIPTWSKNTTHSSAINRSNEAQFTNLACNVSIENIERISEAENDMPTDKQRHLPGV